MLKSVDQHNVGMMLNLVEEMFDASYNFSKPGIHRIPWVISLEKVCTSGDPYLIAAKKISGKISEAGGMPWYLFTSPIDNQVIAFASEMSQLFAEIPPDPRDRTSGHVIFLDSYEVYWRICAKKLGLSVRG